jgi:hypothetical protein
MSEPQRIGDPRCPSELALERWRQGELAGDTGLGAHVESCPACGQRLALLAVPPPPLQLGRRRQPARLGRVVLLPWLGAAVGMAALAVFWLRQPDTQTKGGPWTLGLVARSSDGQVKRIDPGAALRPGDRLRFEVSTRWSEAQAAVISLDSRGVVSALAPTEGPAVAVPAGRRLLLADAVELDDAPGAERIMLVGCRRPFMVAAAVEAARAALVRADGDVRRVGPLGLGCEESTFWITKVSR